jgi:hypothetical protein
MLTLIYHNIKCNSEFLSPSPTYIDPNNLVDSLWNAKDPGHIKFLSTATLPDESFCTDQQPLGLSLVRLSRKSL